MKLSDALWQQLLALRTASRGVDDEARCVCCTPTRLVMRAEPEFDDDVEAVLCREPLERPGWHTETLIDGRLWLLRSPDCDGDLHQALRIYAPLALAPWISGDGSFVLVHMAQSLDGKVSTMAGQSKWIGNEDNLRHAHRLRALVDGVLVGGRTASLDMPRLSVRHVHGEDPARIILSDSFTALGELPRVEGMRTIIVRTSDRNGIPKGRDDFEIARCESTQGEVQVPSLLACLRDAGVHTILVEGGPKTFRAFQQAGAVDWLQLHVAPVLFGSGRPVLQLPEIDAVDDAIALTNPFYTVMGNAIMVTAQL